MKSFIILSSLLFISNVTLAQTKCTGLADGYEEITISEDSVIVHGWDQDQTYKIHSKEDGILFSNTGLLAAVSEDKKSVTMYLGKTQVHKQSECQTSQISTNCSNKKGSLKITNNYVSFIAKKTETKMEITNRDTTFISGMDLESASHGSFNGLAVSISKDKIRSISGRVFNFSCN